MVASLQVSVGTGTKQDEPSSGCVWASGFHHVTARSHWVRVLKLMNHSFLQFSKFFGAAVNHRYAGLPAEHAHYHLSLASMTVVPFIA